MSVLMGQNPEGIRFGRYILHRKVGIGGMAEVWLAEMIGPGGFGRVVALKRLHPQLSKDQEFIDSFISEARVGGSLDHPNIVRTIEFGQEGSSWYLAMEFVQGVSLTALLRTAKKNQTPIPLPVALEIARQLFEGLTYAHGATDPRGRPLELVHRDLKPGNILIDRYGQVRVSDFGIARSTAAVRVTMAAGVLKGTLAYMSPEQASCQKLDARSDLYSAGAMLYELLTQEALYLNPQGLDGLREVMRGDVRVRLNLLRDYPPELVRIVTRLLQPRRDDRYASSLEVLQELQHLQSGWGRATEQLALLVQYAQPGGGGPLIPTQAVQPEEIMLSPDPESVMDLSEELQTSMEPVSELGRLEMTLLSPEGGHPWGGGREPMAARSGEFRSSSGGVAASSLARVGEEGIADRSGQKIGSTIPVVPLGPRPPGFSPPPLEPTVAVATGMMPVSAFSGEELGPMTGFVEMTRASRPFSGVPSREDEQLNQGGGLAQKTATAGVLEPEALQGRLGSGQTLGGQRVMTPASGGLNEPDRAALMAPTVIGGDIPASFAQRTVLHMPVQESGERATVQLLDFGIWTAAGHVGMGVAVHPEQAASPRRSWLASPGVLVGATLLIGAAIGVLAAVFWGPRGSHSEVTHQGGVIAPPAAVQLSAAGTPLPLPKMPSVQADVEGLSGVPSQPEPAARVVPVAAETRQREPEASRPTQPPSAPVPASPPVKSGPRASATARLTVNARPFAWVYVNGKKLPDPTPLWDQKVPAGTLKLKFVAEDGRTVERSVSLKAGESRRLEPVVFEE